MTEKSETTHKAKLKTKKRKKLINPPPGPVTHIQLEQFKGGQTKNIHKNKKNLQRTEEPERDGERVLKVLFMYWVGAKIINQTQKQPSTQKKKNKEKKKRMEESQGRVRRFEMGIGYGERAGNPPRISSMGEGI